MIQLLVFFTCLFAFSFLLFLPALIELKRPQDCGPRRITGFRVYSVSLMNIEDDLKIDKMLLSKLALLFEALPNLEAYFS